VINCVVEAWSKVAHLSAAHLVAGICARALIFDNVLLPVGGSAT
jgi:hypothetical protein